ncbi:PREDICTED: uncharacterized protein LOC104770968 [Camelina sativa]|uniref:Uncharacterized protein LOC104770968 n=1 Tax=Camelina sativa TaxID=90675 RepID=A0ABM0Y0S2_CAMSA|nr:PREDICTED: uncharacterized protein LOC104770968 [Camelina sativa]
MFVAKWSPEVQTTKPELSMVPVWLEFVGVPLQFFNREGLEHIAGLVGHPVCLYPHTENLINVEVAKVYTVIDPRIPLPEAVNAHFESGLIKRIQVSSPWLPSLCNHCKQVGHTVSRCSKAPATCTTCGSVKHLTADCPRVKKDKRQEKQSIASQLPIVGTNPPAPAQGQNQALPSPQSTQPLIIASSPLDSAVSTGTNFLAATNATSSTGNRHHVTLPAPSVVGHSPSRTALRLDERQLCIDLRDNLFSHLSPKDDETADDPSQIKSDSSNNLSEDDDNPEVDEDRFLKVVSKRMQRHKLRKERAGGPINL